jgi:replicative DNA helicase
MEGGGDNRVQELSKITRSLKGLAREIHAPVIALSQLSRSVETRGGDKRPQLSDLRESGAIEQDADIVSFIYRPDYYGITTDEDGQSFNGIGEIIIAKHRNGSLERVRLRFVPEYARFENLHEMPTLEESSPLSNGIATFGQSQNTMILPSKMNDAIDEDKDGIDFVSDRNDDSPF